MKSMQEESIMKLIDFLEINFERMKGKIILTK